MRKVGQGSTSQRQCHMVSFIHGVCHTRKLQIQFFDGLRMFFCGFSLPKGDSLDQNMFITGQFVPKQRQCFGSNAKYK